MHRNTQRRHVLRTFRRADDSARKLSARPNAAQAPRLEALESRRLLAVGPDGFGYTGVETAPLDYDLDRSDFDVVTLMNDHDDNVFQIQLGADQFNFYGENYSSIWVSDNGLITVGPAGNAAFQNTNLLTSPQQRVIAPLWDDFTTAIGSPGSTGDDAVLYLLEDRNGNGTPDRLIIEWENVEHSVFNTGNKMTFQAVLQLNTGTTPGEIYFNYVDLDGGDPTTVDNGLGATVGIKNLGTQSGENAHRLLVSFNQGDNPMVATGKAVKISLGTVDTTPPQVTTSPVFSVDGSQPSLTLTFSEDVGPSLDASDLELLNLTTNQPVTPPAPTYDTNTNTAVFSFAPGTLADGNYRATLKAAGVTDAAANAMASDVDVFFFVLAGDADRDRDVDFQDLVVLAQNYGQTGRTFAQGNFDFDPAGNVGFADLVLLAQRYGRTLAPPPPAPAASAPEATAALTSQESDDAAAGKTLFSTTRVAARPAPARKAPAPRRRA